MERFDSAYENEMPDEAAGSDKNITLLPKGIEGGDVLATADSGSLLEQHLKLEETDAKAFWKDGFILFKLWVTGNFCSMTNTEKRMIPYPYTKDGFYQFLHDHGSQISPDEGGRRMKVFRAYNKYEVTIVRLVEKVGINKAFAAIPHISDATVQDMLQFCIETPYHKLREALTTAYPRHDGGRTRSTKTKEQMRREAETRAVKAISENHTGLLGVPAIFIPRQYRQESVDEHRAHLVFDTAMKRLGINDRDAFFKRVVDLVYNSTMLTDDDRRAVDQILAAQQSGEAARMAYAAD